MDAAEIFDMQEGDGESLLTILHYPLADAVKKRRDNYAYLLEHLPGNPSVCPVYTNLLQDTCPMFFPFLCEDRESLMKHLAAAGIPPEVVLAGTAFHRHRKVSWRTLHL